MKERDRDQPFKTNNICFFTVACHSCLPCCLCCPNICFSFRSYFYFCICKSKCSNKNTNATEEQKTPNQTSLVKLPPWVPLLLTGICYPLLFRPWVPLLFTLEQQLCIALARAKGKSSIAKVRIKTKKSNASFAWSSQPSCACEYSPKERGHRGSKN